MRTRNVIIEIICLLLVLNFFYEGIYKVAYFQAYGFWLKHAPLLKPVSVFLNYLIPFGEVALSLLLLHPRYRTGALYTVIIVLIIYILYIMSAYLFTNRLFFPYHELWEKPTWMQKMLISLGWGWFAFLAIILQKGGLSFKRFSSSSLRNTSVNAS